MPEQTDLDAVETYLRQNLPAYLELLKQMVSINSFTTNPEGVTRLAGLTAGAFEKLGFHSEQIASKNPGIGNHLILSKEGRLNQSVAFISHLDTVFPPEEEQTNQFHWREEGDLVYGPGTVDIKGGTVLIYMLLDAMRMYAPEVFHSFTWKVLLNAAEEALSEDFGRLCKSHLGKQTLACLVFEGGKHTGDTIHLVTSRKGRATFKVVVEGKASHAGNAHKNGANAIEQLAHTLLKISTFTDYDQKITFNVGIIRGGTVVNRVPHHAEAEFEMRAFSPRIFQSGLDRIMALNGSSEVESSDGFPCRVSVQLLDKTAPWPPNPGSRRLLGIWEEAAGEFGFRVKSEARGGLSDGNYLWDLVPTLDGLGPDGGNAHCSLHLPEEGVEQEYIDLSSMIPKTMVNLTALLKITGVL